MVPRADCPESTKSMTGKNHYAFWRGYPAAEPAQVSFIEGSRLLHAVPCSQKAALYTLRPSPRALVFAAADAQQNIGGAQVRSSVKCLAWGCACGLFPAVFCAMSALGQLAG